jgi:hypothetical protein
MSAIVIVLPVVHRPSFHDPAWREQFDRERWAQVFNEMSPPRRTRPLVVVQRQEGDR